MITQLFEAEKNNGERFQRELAEFIVKNKFKTVVETGYGLSTLFIVNAFQNLPEMRDAMLHSIDPAPWYPKEIATDQNELIRKKSVDALPELRARTGPWDLFLHDGNHEIKHVTYELNFAFWCLRIGGVIACDDANWNNNGAWDKFVANRGLHAEKLGTLVYVVKTSGSVIEQDNVEQLHDACLELAENDEADWLSKGNKFSDAFKE